MKTGHLEKLRTLLDDTMEAVLLTGSANRQYATGAVIDEGMCLITRDSAWYLTDSRYTETARKQLPDMEVLEPKDGYYSLIHSLLPGIGTLGIEEEVMSFGTVHRLKAACPLTLVSAQTAVNRLRYSKEPWEWERMKQAQGIADKVFTQMLTVLHAGMTEKEAEAELIYRLYRAGAEGLSFPPIVLSGPNCSMPHGVAGSRILQTGDFVLMDYGVRLGGYCSDMTRTVALGYATDKMRMVYDTVLQAQRAGLAATRAGRTGQEIDRAARNVIENAGFGACFGHSYGHSLGIEIHENPNLSPKNGQPIPAGAVCSAEPGIYLPGELGVRIEDVVMVTPTGCENLTGSPKELLIL